jgi:hypothetical protein
VAQLTISGTDFYADVFTDFQKHQGSSLVAEFSASLLPETGDPVPLEAVTFVDSETLLAQLPGTVPRGLYDVTVVDPHGRSGTITGGLRLVTPAESVAAFMFDPLDPEVAGVPFAVGLTAVDEVGTRVEGFDGTATVTAPGEVPVMVGPFVLGRSRGFVTIAQPAAAVQLSASDALGHSGTSDAFDVTAGDPARVVFIAAPDRIGAGACGGPFTLEVQDTFGNPTMASAPSPFSVMVNPPEGGQLFSDSACAAASASGMLQGRASFFVRSTRAGRPQLRVVPDAWPSAVREVDVDAGAPTGLVVASAPQVLAAGMCSAPVVVRAVDAFGNGAAVASSVPLTVDVEPSTGVTLHDEGTCATMLNSLDLAAGAAEATFFFRSAVPAMLKLSVDGGVLGVAAQGEEVTP